MTRTWTLLTVFAVVVGSSLDLAAQDWRRNWPNSAGSAGQGVRAPMTYRLDPTAMSDQPQHDYSDPTAMSDPYQPQVLIPSGPIVYPQPPISPYPPAVYPPVVPRKQLGITYASTPRGAMVQTVTWGGPAFRIGIEPGDIITQVDGVLVGYAGDLRHAIAYSDGFVTLYIIDVRTGQLIQRNVDVTR